MLQINIPGIVIRQIPQNRNRGLRGFINEHDQRHSARVLYLLLNFLVPHSGDRLNFYRALYLKPDIFRQVHDVI